MTPRPSSQPSTSDETLPGPRDENGAAPAPKPAPRKRAARKPRSTAPAVSAAPSASAAPEPPGAGAAPAEAAGGSPGEATAASRITRTRKTAKAVNPAKTARTTKTAKPAKTAKSTKAAKAAAESSPARTAEPTGPRPVDGGAPRRGGTPAPAPSPEDTPRPAAAAPGRPGAKASGTAPAAGTGATASAAPGTVTARPASPGVVLPEPLGPGERQRLLDGSHHDPHALLGAHPQPGGGVLFRSLRPHARAVTVVADGLRADLHSEGDGLFGGVLPFSEIPDYHLCVAYGDDDSAPEELEQHDPYRFLPTLGELDLHLIGEGRHEQLWQALGAHPMTHQGVTGTRFTVWAPNARGVRVTGDFTCWNGTAYPMRSLGSSGIWELFVPGIGEGAVYKFDITRPDGSHTLRADPMARRTECPPDTASVVTASAHEWSDQEWMRTRAGHRIHQSPFSVYEVHLGSWRPGLTYRQLAEQLPAYVKDLGFTHVELMPVAEHPFGGSWGYQVTSYYAPTARLGSPDDFKYLVDALHREGIGVIMDWVPAHFPKDDWALARFDGTPLYEPADPRRAEHPDWGTLEFDYGRTEVRNFLVANAVYWCEEFHIDGLRVDAVASMLYLDYSREGGDWAPNQYGGRENLDAVGFLQEMNATVYRRCPGVVTIAEESTAWDGVTRATHHTGPGGFGGLGFGLKWNMGWMHDSLGYMAHEPVHRKYHHNEMTFSMVYAYSENYVLPVSHDEVVHGKQALVSKMPGDWWQRRANHRAYLGFMWAHPGKQLLFMGQEFAQGAEWSEAHGPEWWLMDDTYHSAGDHRGVRDLVRDLNRTYAAQPALWQRDTDPSGFTWVDGGAAEDNVFAFLRHDADGTPLLCVSNFSPVVREDYRLGVPGEATAWQEILNTDAAAYGGSDVTNPDPLKPEPTAWHGRRNSVTATLPPLATIWLRPV